MRRVSLISRSFHPLVEEYSLDTLPGYIQEILGAANRGDTSFRNDMQEPDSPQACCPPAGFRVPRGTAHSLAHRTGAGPPTAAGGFLAYFL
jgi:hypothetical protein